MNKLKEFYQANKIFLLVFAVGIMGFGVSIIAKQLGPYEIPGYWRLITYLSALLAAGSLYLWTVKNNRTIVANALLVVNLLIVMELVFFFMLGMPGSFKKSFKLPVLPEDHIGKQIGDVPLADSIYHAVLVNQGDTVYDVRYSIDKENKRITPDRDSLKKKYALFFGCSIAFGQGLEDNQTMAYYLQQKSDCNAYNYSYPGYGTNHMLARLQFQDISKSITEKEGAAFYIFFWDHMYRSIGSMNRYSDWLMNAPYFEMQDGKLVRNKMFKDGRYLTSKFYQYAYNSNTIKYFKLDFPVTLKPRHIELVTNMMAESKAIYQKQFGNDKFYVVMVPNYNSYKPEEYALFKKFLKEKNIRYIDLSGIIEYGGKYTLDGDPHPNAATNELVATELLKRYTTNQIE